MVALRRIDHDGWVHGHKLCYSASWEHTQRVSGAGTKQSKLINASKVEVTEWSLEFETFGVMQEVVMRKDAGQAGAGAQKRTQICEHIQRLIPMKRTYPPYNLMMIKQISFICSLADHRHV